jgi:alkylation response protein AidB-like acyl-CoA dehydrogenase
MDLSLNADQIAILDALDSLARPFAAVSLHETGFTLTDVGLAAFHAQETARVVVYDFHQFLGGMGMTLEHPLHLWTYHLKFLTGEIGGRGGNALAAAEALWG